jgi:phosphatidylglycerophosphate synthase
MALSNVDMATSPHFQDLKVEPHNSRLRDIFSRPINWAVAGIDSNYPAVKPSDITTIGEILVDSASLMLINNPESTILATSVFTAGNILDALDGQLDRVKRQKNNEEPSVKGMLEDLLADRRGEMATLAALSLVARQRGYQLAANNYAIAAATTSLPSFYRAKAEANGYIVKEDGLGSRVGRAVLAGMGIAFNRNRNVSEVISSTIAGTSVFTAIGRRAVFCTGDNSRHYRAVHSDAKIKENAEIRLNALKPIARVGLGIGVGLVAYRSDRLAKK